MNDYALGQSVVTQTDHGGFDGWTMFQKIWYALFVLGCAATFAGLIMTFVVLSDLWKVLLWGCIALAGILVAGLATGRLLIAVRDDKAADPRDAPDTTDYSFGGRR
ncbi:hypothetical protein [Halosimplex pelagicum]|uniref:Uncharacterized protein n=1 Tax=Halosimplex pelagicum TaxID=869886 RepID=A0A7D5P959_9EURY|nr:hypothetical protein [Halosimplex pelagicum]QLH80522.1 hypothetical protein HZS54_02240 [Halosimplex pelagicum]